MFLQVVSYFAHKALFYPQSLKRVSAKNCLLTNHITSIRCCRAIGLHHKEVGSSGHSHNNHDQTDNHRHLTFACWLTGWSWSGRRCWWSRISGWRRRLSWSGRGDRLLWRRWRSRCLWWLIVRIHCSISLLGTIVTMMAL